MVIVDEIGTEAEALACRTIAERGVMLVGTAHGQLLENLIKNPTLCDLVRWGDWAVHLFEGPIERLCDLVRWGHSDSDWDWDWDCSLEHCGS